MGKLHVNEMSNKIIYPNPDAKCKNFKDIVAHPSARKHSVNYVDTHRLTEVTSFIHTLKNFVSEHCVVVSLC